MKKLTLLLAAMAIAISASAGVQFKNTHADLKNRKFVAPTTKMVKKQQMRDVVTDQPAGELKTYKRAGES